MNTEIIKYDGCTYQCYLKELKSRTGRTYYRAFCRREDVKCIPGIRYQLEQKYAPHIRATIERKPKYTLWGREFWIIGNEVFLD